MSRTHFFLMLSVAVIVASVFILLEDSSESDAATAEDVRVFIERADGTYAETKTSGTSVKQIIENACDNLDMEITYTRLGMIKSVDGISSQNTEYWNIHQWMPLGTHDWASVGFDDVSNSQVITGTTYCLHMSGQVMKNGSNVYITPDFRPESKGYVFIRFDYGYDSSDPQVQEAFTVEDRINGFWIEGYGCNMGEVVMDAMNSNGFESKFITSVDSNGNDLQYWITSFFGIEGSTNLGSSTSWAYWSQYIYVNDKWSYNDWTLGYYDPAVYKYTSVVYIVSIDYTSQTGEEQNVLTTLPDVTDESAISAQVKSRNLTATFEIDGETVGTVDVSYGHAVPATPTVPEKEGYYFSGWGDLTSPLNANTTFRGTYLPHSADRLEVKYTDENGSHLYTESVESGSPAVYNLVPKKDSTFSTEYVFKGWSADGSSIIDLSSVTSNLTLSPLFESQVRKMTITFFGADGTVLVKKQVYYGQALEDIPEGPVRADAVDKVYTFAGWAIAMFTDTQMDYSLKADFTSITSSKVVFAAYTYVPHPYTLSVKISGDDDISIPVVYGGFLTESMMMDSVDGYMLKFFRNQEMTQAVGTSFMFTGNTTLYASKVIGDYTFADTDKTTVSVDIPAASVEDLAVNGGAYVVCDVSEFSGDKTVLLDKLAVSRLYSHLGGDKDISIILPRGTVIINLDGLAGLLGLKTLAGLSDDNVTVTITKGPTSSVRINSSLKNVSWDSSYTVTVKINGRTVTDPAGEGLSVRLSLPYEDENSVSPMVWSANANTGLLTSIPCSASDGRVTFTAAQLPYYVVGTSAPRSNASGPEVQCPYGVVDYSCAGEDTDTYRSTLNRMDIDCRGEVLYLPSSLEGYPLRTVGPNAFAGVLNTTILVVPASVTSFDWSSLYQTGVREVYFMGDMPEFTGEAPASVTVYRSDKSDTWSSYPAEVLSILNYSKGKFSFNYCLIDDSIMVTKWVKGAELDIPAAINVNGTEYPVKVIGCNAFEKSSVTHVRIPDSIEQIQTRAFYQCSSLEQIMWGQSPSVKILADECFRACLKLRSSTETIPEGVGFIGFEAFRDCHMFRTLVIPNTVSDIRGGAFYNCTSLADVTLSNALKSIPERCFGYCSSLDGVIIPDSVTEIRENAFYRCSVLRSINTNNAETVGNSAFYDCQNLENVTLGKGLKTIGNESLGHNLMLTNVYAYCGQPQGFASCGMSESATLYANYDLAANWSAPHQVLEKEDDLRKSFEAATMPYVVGSMILIIILLGVLTWRYRSKYLV